MVYKLTPNLDGSWTENILHRFTGGKDGGFLYENGVVLGASGELYGTTVYGGSGACNPGCGVVFELTMTSNGKWVEHVLHTFQAKPAYEPGQLLLDTAGNLYGPAGSTGNGVVFEVEP